jgi:hypothetical protein
MSEAPMPLDYAVRRFFPHGGVSKEQMLAAIRKGRLKAEKIGRAYLVTSGSIREWRKSCARNYPPDSGPASAKAASRDGSLSMEERKSTLAAALAITRGLKLNSEPTLPKRNKSTPRAGTPIRLVSQT